MNYLVRFVLGLYPPWWRRRYGKETRELTEELLADPDINKLRTLGSLLFGATTAWTQIKRRADYLQPVASGVPPMAPLHFPPNVKSRRGVTVAAVAGLVCVALIGVGVWYVTNGFFTAVGKGVGQALVEASESGAANALSADKTARTHGIRDGALTLSLLNNQHVGVDWISGDRSVQISDRTTYVSIGVGDDHIVTAVNQLGCAYGLTVAAANDPIIAKDQLPGVGTYYEFNFSDGSQTSSCSAASAPTSGWLPVTPSQLEQTRSKTSGSGFNQSDIAERWGEASLT